MICTIAHYREKDVPNDFIDGFVEIQESYDNRPEYRPEYHEPETRNQFIDQTSSLVDKFIEKAITYIKELKSFIEDPEPVLRKRGREAVDSDGDLIQSALKRRKVEQEEIIDLTKDEQIVGIIDLTEDEETVGGITGLVRYKQSNQEEIGSFIGLTEDEKIVGGITGLRDEQSEEKEEIVGGITGFMRDEVSEVSNEE